MGFRQGAYAKVWSAEDKGKYSVGRISISKKNKNTDRYEVEFQDGFVRFIGDAHDALKNLSIDEKKGASIQITSCDVTNKYDAEKKKTYTNFAIFGFDVPGGGNTGGKKDNGNNGKQQTIPEVDPEDDDLPF